jgi:HlyD family secretion protein
MLASAGKDSGEGQRAAAGKSAGPPGSKDPAALKRLAPQDAQKNPSAPKSVTAQGNPNGQKSHSDHGQIWVKDGVLARPVRVRIGVTDGIETEVSGRDLKEGMDVIVGEVTPDEAAAMNNPFAPKLFNKTGGAPKTRP